VPHSLFGPATTTTDIKPQDIEHSPVPEPFISFPIEKSTEQTTGPLLIVASKRRRAADMM
jgi:hypothetical protein